ncbi:MAG: PQQ-binding-like beta-propeller repeat protein, partial [Vulcanimicrobiaceae bacterium]
AAHLALAQPQLAPAGPPADDWTTFAHDQMRTGFQAQPTGITVANVGQLAPRWVLHTGEPTSASPLVSGGRVYIASQSGTVRALDVLSGTLIWQTNVGGSIVMTPTLADGKLFVGTHDSPATFAALDAATGAVQWRVSRPGVFRSEPAVEGGLVVEGLAGGDPPDCVQGGVFAFDENTGAVRWSWQTSPNANDGGAVWSPISFDGNALYFGTGNTCTKPTANANAIVSVDLAGSLRWAVTGAASISDDDFGGGVLLDDDDAFATGKNAQVYELNAATGSVDWQAPLGAVDGYGGIGTPTTDGTMLIASTGDLADPTVNPVPGGKLLAYDDLGNVRWSVASLVPVAGYAALAGGIAFADLDNAVVALDVNTGAKLWSAAGPSPFYASPAIVPSGLYVVDTAGNVTAYGLTGQSQSLRRTVK